MFFKFGRHVGWRLVTKYGFPTGMPLLLCPLSSLRFFEFDFVNRWLPDHWEIAFDASSTYLFSLFQVYQDHSKRVKYLNPDPCEKQQIQKALKCMGLMKSIDLSVAGVEDVTDSAEKYDVVWSISVIEHIKNDIIDDIGAVLTLYGILKPGGRLIFTVPVDRNFWEEYRNTDPYGTQVKQRTNGVYFFQRFYDEAAIINRFERSIGCKPIAVEWYGENQAGRFHSYTNKWMNKGISATLNDAYEFTRHYKQYSTWNDMPGAGVCGLVFEKPRIA